MASFVKLHSKCPPKVDNRQVVIRGCPDMATRSLRYCQAVVVRDLALKGPGKPYSLEFRFSLESRHAHAKTRCTIFVTPPNKKCTP